MAENLRFVAAVSRASAEARPRISLPVDALFKISVGFPTDNLKFFLRNRVLPADVRDKKQHRLLVVLNTLFGQEQRALDNGPTANVGCLRPKSHIERFFVTLNRALVANVLHVRVLAHLRAA